MVNIARKPRRLEEPVPADPRTVSEEELARRLYPVAKALARRYYRPGPVGYDDLVADTWTRLFLTARRWQPGGTANVLTFALSHAKHEFLKSAQRLRLFGPQDGEPWRRMPIIGTGATHPNGEPMGVALADPTPEPELYAADLGEWEADAGPRPWEALRLVTLEGLTTAEAADRLGVTPDRVRTLAAVAVRRIRDGMVRRRVAAGRPE